MKQWVETKRSTNTLTHTHTATKTQRFCDNKRAPKNIWIKLFAILFRLRCATRPTICTLSRDKFFFHFCLPFTKTFAMVTLSLICILSIAMRGLCCFFALCNWTYYNNRQFYKGVLCLFYFARKRKTTHTALLLSRCHFWLPSYDEHRVD